MASQLASRLGSSLIELIADHGRKSFFVHTNLLTAQSSLTPAPSGRNLDLKTWDSKTITHLVNFLYLGTYDVAQPEPYDTTEASSDTTTTATHSRACTPDTQRSAEQNSPSLAILRESPNENITGDPAPVVLEHLYQQHYSQDTHDYGRVLFEHARIYALAQSLVMHGLRHVAYRRFSAILDGMKKIASSVVARSLAEVLCYVYTHVEVRGGPLRQAVSQFVAVNFQMLFDTDQMRFLLTERADVAVSVLLNVHARLVAAEVAAKDALEKATAIPARETEVRGAYGPQYMSSDDDD